MADTREHQRSGKKEHTICSTNVQNYAKNLLTNEKENLKNKEYEKTNRQLEDLLKDLSSQFRAQTIYFQTLGDFDARF